jgi:hypothetical protein
LFEFFAEPFVQRTAAAGAKAENYIVLRDVPPNVLGQSAVKRGRLSMLLGRIT